MSTRDIASELRTAATAIEMYQAEQDAAKQMGFHDCGEALAYLKNLEQKISEIKNLEPWNVNQLGKLLKQLTDMVES